ncbi:hypothetical protein PIB30_048937 [Stylosanthes scabra]|uniref:CASP-like protein n=1 Tax=Stylosanthes scabra TaxID=79078 RepID=A0ABU6YHE5_9FABA|nr:hypothetical protein [Stylosanthes scabra]
MILGLGVLASVLIGTDSQVRVFFSFEKEAEFTNVKALVFLVLANDASAGQSAMFAKEGQQERQWMKVCNIYEKFCNQVEEVASAVVVSISMVLVFCISSFSLFRLYGPNKTKFAVW